MGILHSAIHRLAVEHHHAWADHVTTAECEADWSAAQAKAAAALDATEAVQRPFMGPGLRPSTHHTTGTGRLSWDLNGDMLTIAIHRPATDRMDVPGRSQDAIVAYATIEVFEHGLDIFAIESDGKRCELRHIDVLIHAVTTALARFPAIEQLADLGYVARYGDTYRGGYKYQGGSDESACSEATA